MGALFAGALLVGWRVRQCDDAPPSAVPSVPRIEIVERKTELYPGEVVRIYWRAIPVSDRFSKVPFVHSIGVRFGSFVAD